MKYVNAKTAIQKMLIQKDEPLLVEKIRGNIEVNNRIRKMITLDTTRLKISKHAFQYRLISLRDVTLPWMLGICEDRLKIELKKAFFK